jgi:hypothetical protein
MEVKKAITVRLMIWPRRRTSEWYGQNFHGHSGIDIFMTHCGWLAVWGRTRRKDLIKTETYVVAFLDAFRRIIKPSTSSEFDTTKWQTRRAYQACAYTNALA